jgi:putative Holliday junction resolvase
MPEPAAADRLPAAQLVLAFDFGRKRIGVACGDTLSRTATVLSGVMNGVQGPRWQTVDTLLKEWQPTVLVVGLPYNADGSESAMSAEARSFAAALTLRYALPVRLIDERYSSLEAEARLKSQRAAGLRKRRLGRADVDAAAAGVILERWFSESS